MSPRPERSERQIPSRMLRVFADNSILALKRFTISVAVAGGIGYGAGKGLQQGFRYQTGFEPAIMAQKDERHRARAEKREGMTKGERMLDMWKDSWESMRRNNFNPLKSIPESQVWQSGELAALRAVNYLDSAVAFLGFLVGFIISIKRVRRVVDNYLKRQRDVLEKEGLAADIQTVAEALLAMENAMIALGDKVNDENRKPSEEEGVEAAQAHEALVKVIDAFPPELRRELEKIATAKRLKY